MLISYLEASSGASTVWKYVIEGSKYTHWIGLYLSFYLNWVLGPFVDGRLQNLETGEITFADVITPLTLSGFQEWVPATHTGDIYRNPVWMKPACHVLQMCLWVFTGCLLVITLYRMQERHFGNGLTVRSGSPNGHTLHFLFRRHTYVDLN